MSAARIRVVLFDLGETLVHGSHWIPGAKDALDALATAGFRLGIISNTGNLTRADLVDALPSTFDFARFEDDLIILSSEVGIEKPARTIFRLAVARAATPASAVLFCTEDPLDALAAQKAGLRALRVLPPPDGEAGKIPALLAQLANL